MPKKLNRVPLAYKIQWQTIKTIWNSLQFKEVFPFLFEFIKVRFRIQRTKFWKEWKSKQPDKTRLKFSLDLIAFYLAYREIAGTERALLLVLTLLKKQSSEVFWEVVELFRRYGIKIL